MFFEAKLGVCVQIARTVFDAFSGGAYGGVDAIVSGIGQGEAPANGFSWGPPLYTVTSYLAFRRPLAGACGPWAAGPFRGRLTWAATWSIAA